MYSKPQPELLSYCNFSVMKSVQNFQEVLIFKVLYSIKKRINRGFALNSLLVLPTVLKCV